LKHSRFSKKAGLRTISGLLFLSFLFSGFSLSSSKPKAGLTAPRNFEDLWQATLATLDAEKSAYGCE